MNRTEPIALPRTGHATCPAERLRPDGESARSGPRGYPSPQANDRALVVEDEAYLRTCVARLLRSNGWEVDVAACADDAERLLDAHGYKVVIVDLIIPGGHGLQLVRQARAQGTPPAVIVTTGVVDQETHLEALRLGVADLVFKPFDRARLLRALGSTPQS